MEALTAIGLIANIVQFVDLGAKLIGSAKEMQASASGMTTENKSLEEVTIEMRNLTLRLEPTTTEAKSDDERALRRLAQECRELSERILRLLKKIASGKPNSKLHTMRSAIRNIKYKDDKRELEEKLANCRGQLHLHLSKLTSSEVLSQLQDIRNLAQSNEGTVRAAVQQIKLMRRGTCVSSLGIEAQDQIKALLGLTQMAQETIIIKDILKGLVFEGIQARVDVIEREHTDTFRWIVEQEADVDDTTLKTNARELYLSWLHDGCGIFHVAGKLGSGKSTLMKFLCKHPETRSQLLGWAGRAKLVMASHFFWKPAKLPLQKSLNGLERSLLYQILKSHQELTKKAFPTIWEQMMNTQRGPMELPPTLSSDEIHDAFMALLGDETIQRSYRFCFFIDALDEQQDSHQYDHRYMVDALRKWTQISPTSIKLCVSSREENVFENAFACDPRIRLQDLTRYDMERFVRSRLESMPEHDIRERLTREIVKRSDGIFLWVVLVVKQLRQALEDGHDTSSLEKELATLPTELEELFTHLLDSIPKLQRREAFRIFAMVLEHETLKTKLSLFSCLHLDKYDADSQLAAKGHSTRIDLNTQDEDKLQTWYDAEVKRARRRLHGYCKGLVEDRPAPEVHKDRGFLAPTASLDNSPWAYKRKRQWTYPDPSKPAGSRCILFVHRTIVEFLERSTGLNPVARPSDQFDVVELISQLHLAEFQSIPRPLIDPLYWIYLYSNLMGLRLGAGKDRSQFDFLMRLECIISRTFPHLLETKLPPNAEYVARVGYEQCVLTARTDDSAHQDLKSEVLVPFYNPVLISAWLGNASYVLWRTTKPNKTPLSNQLAGVTLHCLSHSFSRLENFEDFEATVVCFERLLGESASPVTHFLWPNFLINCCTREWHHNMFWSRTMGQLLEVFLRKYKGESVAMTRISVAITCYMGITITQMYIHIGDNTVLKLPIGEPNHGTTSQILQGRGLSLEELVNILNFENKAEIIELIREAQAEAVNDAKPLHPIETDQEIPRRSVSDGTSASESISKSLQRIDSAAEIQNTSIVTLSSPAKSIASVLPPHPQAAKSHTGRVIGITTVISLLVLLLAFLISHQDYLASMVFSTSQ